MILEGEDAERAREALKDIASPEEIARRTEALLKFHEKVTQPKMTADTTLDSNTTPTPQPARFRYKNHRGETSNRTVDVIKIWYGSTKEHKEPQWFLKAFCHEKQAERNFAIADILQWYR